MRERGAREVRKGVVGVAGSGGGELSIELLWTDLISAILDFGGLPAGFKLYPG